MLCDDVATGQHYYGECAMKYYFSFRYLNDEIFTDGILNKDGSLTIPSADELHRGHFKCVAENEVGIDERIVVLTVHTAPTIEGSGQV